MDVTLSTDSRRIAELLRHRLNGGQHLLLRFIRAARSRLAQQCQRLERRKPGAEILRGEEAAARLAQVFVHIAGADWTALAVLIDPLEQFLARDIAAVAHDARDSPIRDERALLDSALAAKLQHERTTLQLDVSIA